MRGLLLVLLALGATGAYADTPFYAGGGLGITDYDQKVDLTADDPFDGPIDVDISGDAFGYNFFGGFELNPEWAFELGWINFGSRKQNIESFLFDDRFKFESRAVYLNAQYHIPLTDQLSLDLALGYAFAKGKASLTSRDDNPGPSQRDNFSDDGFMAGLGATIKVTDLVYVRATGNYFDITYDEDDAPDFIDEPIRFGIDVIVDF